MRAAPGRSSRKSPSRFAAKFHRDEADTGDVAPRPVETGDEAIFTGSPPTANTIGTVGVAALAASAAGVLPTITATCRRTRSAARRRQPIRLAVAPSAARWRRSGPRHSLPRFMPLRKLHHDQARTAERLVLRRSPTTGIAGCCARAANGHARRAAEQRDELAASHSNTSLARAVNASDNETPSRTAALRLIAMWNRVACSIGKSAGLPPFAIRST